MKIIDTHCHPYLNRKKSLNDILENFFKNSGEAMIIIGTDLENSLESVKIAKQNKNIFVTIGIHPCDIGKLDLEETIEKLENIYKENKEKIVAIGEIGLDYYRIEKDSEKFFESGKIKDKQKYISETKIKQKYFFEAQINLAKKLNLPIVIHNRESKDDIFEILKKLDFKNFVFHCFSENLNFAEKLLDFAPNAMISFSGIVTFKSAENVREAAKNLPLKNILAETDSPYLTPVPFRGKQENEPIFTRYVIEEIANLRNENVEKIAESIFQNSKNFFNI
ncbi:TatD family hydrolase [Candidatus Gracilibacteria bacterium]|nr:TatD family hydrolase [Candidatus Gracilibacteria bacterium]MBF0913603.1 TatD family hydrolase [Candidatus Gracilibacteria bacterium]